MSFVVAMPDLIQGTAQDLAGIQASLGEAAVAVAAPTTGVLPAAADEVSAVIAAMFGDFGREFQRVSAWALAFHANFVDLMNAGAGAYLSSEIANAELALKSILSGAPMRLPTAEATLEISLVPELAGGGAGGTGFTDFAGSYASLIGNTGANLQSLGTGWLAAPFPFLRQVIANQIGYAQLVATALGNAAQSFRAALSDLPAAFQAASQAFATGNYVGGLSDVVTGFESLFTSAAGDLSPVFFGTTADISQNISNVVNALTDTSMTFESQLDTSNLPASLGNSMITFNMGLPLALGFDAIGAPITTISAFATSEAAFTSALRSGNFAAALTALVDAPAVVANGFLNGHATWTLRQSFSTDFAVPVQGVTVVVPVSEQAMIGIPLGGLLSPLAPSRAVVGPITVGPVTVPEFTIPIPDVTVGPFPVVIPLPAPFPPFTYTIPAFTVPIPDATVGPFTSPPVTYGPYPFTVQGTPIGGIIPALVNYAPRQLAIAIGAPA
jgi:hypothetical protein